MSATTTPSGAGASSPQTGRSTPATDVSNKPKFEDPAKYKWSSAIGEDCSWKEWHARRRCGLCQWCLSDSHATTMCQVQLQDKREAQAVALGNAAIGAEKARRREAHLCIYCGAKGHMVKTCLKKTRADLEAKERSEVDVVAKAKEARRQAWLEKEAKEKAAAEKKAAEKK